MLASCSYGIAEGGHPPGPVITWDGVLVVPKSRWLGGSWSRGVVGMVDRGPSLPTMVTNPIVPSLCIGAARHGVAAR